MYRLSRAELLELARPFPIALRRIRWEALRLAIMRTIVATHREQLKAQAKASAPNSAPPPSKPPSSPVQMPQYFCLPSRMLPMKLKVRVPG